MNTGMSGALLAVLAIVHSGCKNQANPLDKLFPKTHSDIHNLAQAVATDFPHNSTIARTVITSNASSQNQAIKSEVLAKEMNSLPVVSAEQFAPSLPPEPVPPLPVDDLNGYIEYDGPIYSLCGNGVLNRVVNRIVCPISAPFVVLPDGMCAGFVYIEQCDDGNTFDNDGCSSVCLKECCGNGIVEEGEQCDLGQNKGPVLPNISPPANFPIDLSAFPFDNFAFNIPFPPCSRPDLVTDSQNCSRNCQLIICGDCIVNGLEQCDDGNNIPCDGCYQCVLERKKQDFLGGSDCCICTPPVVPATP